MLSNLTGNNTHQVRTEMRNKGKRERENQDSKRGGEDRKDEGDMYVYIQGRWEGRERVKERERERERERLHC